MSEAPLGAPTAGALLFSSYNRNKASTSFNVKRPVKAVLRLIPRNAKTLLPAKGRGFTILRRQGRLIRLFDSYCGTNPEQQSESIRTLKPNHSCAPQSS